MTLGKNIFTLILVFVFIAIGIIIFVLFKANKGINNNYSQIVKSMDNTIAAVKNEREAYQLTIDEKLNKNVTLEQIDSLLAVHYRQDQIKYLKLEQELKNIPDRIALIAGNDSSIRAAYQSFR